MVQVINSAMRTSEKNVVRGAMKSLQSLWCCDSSKVDRRRFATALILVVSILVPTAVAGDWPQWRYGANRSGATEEEGPQSAELLWQLSLDHPDPAYDHQFRMCADVSYAPVAAEGLVFIPSNMTDQVTARDLATGVLRWRFFAEAPVRLAPVYEDGKVYFGADDGYLYCVSAQEGTLLWKARGTPEELPDSRMLINGRLCSRWPVRGAPVAYGGMVYFGAGVWPEEGVYVVAVDGRTGQLRWRSDAMSYVKNGMSDHGRPYDLSLPPQGYLAVIDGKLAVPSGRSLAAWFDLQTGTMEPYTCFYVKTSPPRGTWYLSGIGRYCVQGGNWFGTREDALPTMPAALADAKSALFWSREPPSNELYVLKHRPFFNTDTVLLHDENLYSEPVLTQTTSYASEFFTEKQYVVPRGHTSVRFPATDRIVARDLTAPRWQSTMARHTGFGRRKVRMPRMEFPVLWELKSSLRVLIKAAGHLYAGGENTVAAIAIPAGKEQPHVAWQAEIDGTPVHALVAGHKLVVTTHNGNVYCFDASDHQPAPASLAAGPRKGPRETPAKGYAALFGWGDGSGAETLARDAAYRVTVFEPDPVKAKQARERLAASGRYGQQVQILPISPNCVQLTPYWANLVVIESVPAFGRADATLSKGLDLLRPHTGMLRVPDGRQHFDLVKRLIADRPGFAATLEGEKVIVRRHAPPVGADDWTHEAGGPDNCFASSDRLVKCRLRCFGTPVLLTAISRRQVISSTSAIPIRLFSAVACSSSPASSCMRSISTQATTFGRPRFP